MNHHHRCGHETRHDWGREWHHFGRAAERLARRMMHDAQHFAERVEEHVGGFARDVRRDWRSAAGDDPTADVRRVFEGVRRILAGVLDGVDDIIAGFDRPAADDSWTKVVYNRDAACSACGKTTAAGAEGFVRRTAEGVAYRCAECGPPAA